MQRVQQLADLTRAPGLDYVSLDPGGQTPPPRPLFLFGRATPIVLEEIFGQLDTPPVGCYHLPGGGVAANGIPMQGDIALTAPSLLHPPDLVAITLRNMQPTTLPRRHIDGALAVIYGPAYQTYGHWLADFLPRLWVLAAAGHAIDCIAYVVPPDLPAFARDLLAATGMTPAQIVAHDYWHEHLTADVLLVPTGLRLGNRFSPRFGEATRFWIDRLRARTPVPPSAAGTRLFLSRSKIPKQRTMLNRDAIEAIAAARGYTPISPETLPIAEQVAVFAGASMLAGEYGSALHGAVYAAPRTVTCALRGNARHPSFLQTGIGAALGQHTGYVLGDTPGQTVEQRFSIDRADFERALDIVEAQASTPG